MPRKLLVLGGLALAFGTSIFLHGLALDALGLLASWLLVLRAGWQRLPMIPLGVGPAPGGAR